MEMLHIRLPKETHRAIKVLTASRGISMTVFIGDLIERYLLENKGEI